jgi:asparagine synthase (glutamine-hydrolysing)
VGVIDEFRELLYDSVKMHLMSEVPVGALLSGGIDSTTNVALMRRITQKPFKTVTVGFEANGYDEAEQAAASARALGTEHHTIIFKANAMDEYPQILHYQEEPVARATFTALYFLFKACRQQGLKVVLTGEGADELLGGYSWHQAVNLPGLFSKLPNAIRSTLAPSRKLRALWKVGRDINRILFGAPSDIHRRYQALLSIGDSKLAYNLLSSEVKSALNKIDPQPILEAWANWLPAVANQPEFQQILFLQSRTRMVDYVNHIVDRMSMAHSIEARPPFMDHKLWEFCAPIPPNLKLFGSYPNQKEKYLLREATRNLIPEPVRLRRKKPLRVPYEAWLSQDCLPEWAEIALSEGQLKKTGLFDPKIAVQLRQDYLAGAPGRATLLMGVLAIQVWADKFLESPLGSFKGN